MSRGVKSVLLGGRKGKRYTLRYNSETGIYCCKIYYFEDFLFSLKTVQFFEVFPKTSLARTSGVSTYSGRTRQWIWNTERKTQSFVWSQTIRK